MSLTNPFARWQALQPKRLRQVGEVVAIDGDVATVELPSGARVQTVGQAAVSDRVYIRDGAIEGAAPVLTYVTAEV